jgi:hypothetical protein
MAGCWRIGLRKAKKKDAEDIFVSGPDTWIAWGDSANAKLQTAKLTK